MGLGGREEVVGLLQVAVGWVLAAVVGIAGVVDIV